MEVQLKEYWVLVDLVDCAVTLQMTVEQTPLIERTTLRRVEKPTSLTVLFALNDCPVLIFDGILRLTWGYTSFTWIVVVSDKEQGVDPWLAKA